MKELIKKLIVFKLKLLAKYYLKVNKIGIIAVTGSAGKTTTKVALQQFLPESLVYVPVENYNTEIGVPLAIFKEKTPDNITSLGAWSKLIFRMFKKLFLPSPYKKIVLEISADHIGDIKYLTSFIKPEISIITTVLPVHTLEFKTIENIAREKGYLAEATLKKGTVILNADNKYVRQMANRAKANVLFVGQDRTAETRWENVKFAASGINFDLLVRGQKYKVKTKIFAEQLIFSLVAALQVGVLLGLDIRDLLNALANFSPEKGRMNILEGIKTATIIDDSYNGNPASIKAALDVLGKMKGRKIAVLGSMKELGPFEELGHKEVIEQARKTADFVILVGEEMRKYSLKIRKSAKFKVFDNSIEAGEYVQKIIETGDILLFKGSQSMYIEEAIKPILKDVGLASGLLVRQSKMWEDKKEKFFERKQQ